MTHYDSIKQMNLSPMDRASIELYMREGDAIANGIVAVAGFLASGARGLAQSAERASRGVAGALR